jgi:hypothetical protein
MGILRLTTTGQPRGASVNEVSEAEKSVDDGRLPALDCAGLLNQAAARRWRARAEGNTVGMGRG